MALSNRVTADIRPNDAGARVANDTRDSNLNGFRPVAPKALLISSLGQRPREMISANRRALKARLNRALAYKFFAAQLPTRSNAFSIFSIELATLKRK